MVRSQSTDVFRVGRNVSQWSSIKYGLALDDDGLEGFILENIAADRYFQMFFEERDDSFPDSSAVGSPGRVEFPRDAHFGQSRYGVFVDLRQLPLQDLVCCCEVCALVGIELIQPWSSSIKFDDGLDRCICVHI